MHATEAKWLPVWDELDPFRADDDSPREKRYALTMFPYPSGDLHMGHAEVTALHDVIARYWWQRGYEVLNPIGWDSFGLPAENAAIQRNEHPATYTYANIETQAASFKKYAVSFDWSRRLHTSDPEYYRWTQWLFLKLRERGLAYRKSSPVNWCPNDQTVLANEQVVDGFCERCGAEVTKRELTQWYFKVTDYAQRLLDDMDGPGLARAGADPAAQLDRPLRGRARRLRGRHRRRRRHAGRLASTRPGPTRCSARRSWWSPPTRSWPRRSSRDEQRAAYEDYLAETRKASDIDRMATDRPKTGVFLGAHAVNPVNGETVPVWAADYVLADYGTGAIMAVPGQDQRDWDFAKTFDLPIVRTVQPPEDWEGEAFTGNGPAINSANETVSLDGLAIDEAKRTIIAYLEEQGTGRGAVNFRLRDWLLSRQRFWGCPIPVVHCPVDGEVDVPEDQLPVVLPELKGADLKPKGVSPLAAAEDWVNVECPKCGGPAKRDSDTMDTFVDSSVVLPALLLAARRHPGLRPGQGAPVDAGRAVRRRRRARGAAPAVQPVLHQGAARHGHGRLRRAVHRAAEPGRGDQPGQEDEQVAGQRRQPGGPACGLRRRRRSADPGLRRAARGQHRLGRHVAGRLAAVPAAGLAAVRRRDLGARHLARGR